MSMFGKNDIQKNLKKERGKGTQGLGAPVWLSC